MMFQSVGNKQLQKCFIAELIRPKNAVVSCDVHCGTHMQNKGDLTSEIFKSAIFRTCILIRTTALVFVSKNNEIRKRSRNPEYFKKSIFLKMPFRSGFFISNNLESLESYHAKSQKLSVRKKTVSDHIYAPFLKLHMQNSIVKSEK